MQYNFFDEESIAILNILNDEGEFCPLVTYFNTLLVLEKDKSENT